MAEMLDVATLTTISSDWGNDIRDRTIQRYTSVAVRTTEHPSPAEGDLSYLEDSNTVWVYDGSAWIQLVPGPVATANIADSAVSTVKIADSAVTSVKIADGTVAAGDLAASAVGAFIRMDSAVDNTQAALTTALSDILTVTFDLTALGWTSAGFLAWGSVVAATTSGTAELGVRIAIVGSFGPEAQGQPAAISDSSAVSASHDASSGGGGSKVITLQAREIGGELARHTASLSALAVRLT